MQLFISSYVKEKSYTAVNYIIFHQSAYVSIFWKHCPVTPREDNTFQLYLTLQYYDEE